MLKSILLLLHAFFPFITYDIYNHLLGPAGDGGQPPNILFGPWPTAETGFEDDALEGRLAQIQTVVNAIRNVRSEMNVPPGKRADVYIRIDDDDLGAVLNQHIDYYKGLARINQIMIGPDVKKPPMSASAVIPGAEIFLPLEGLIDIEMERTRLSKELENLRGQLEKLSRKLANGDYLTNAPAEVVNRDRTKKAEYEDRVEKINANLEQLMNW